MAINLTSKTNTDPAGAYGGKSYPYGKIKDDVLPGDGTPVNTEVYGDFHQLLAKIMAEAGQAYNGLPENATDGFQYFQALQKLMYGAWTNSGVVFENDVPGANEWDNKGGSWGKFHYNLLGNKVHLSGVMHNSSASSPASPVILTLPAAVRPSVKVVVTAWEDLAGGGTLTPVVLYINTDGTVVPESTGSGDTDVYFDGISYKIGADSY